MSVLQLRKLANISFHVAALFFCLLGSSEVVHADSYTYTLFNGPGSSGSTFLYGINNSDQLIGVSNGQDFLSSNGVFTTLASVPEAINNNGDVLGGYSDGSGNFLYSNGTTTTLSKNGYNVGYRGINDADTVVGTYEAPGGPIGYGQPVMVT